MLILFLPSGPKVPLLFPALDREGCIFGRARQKNRIRTMGENKECLRSHVCHFTCDLGHSLLLLPRGVIYYCMELTETANIIHNRMHHFIFLCKIHKTRYVCRDENISLD